VAIFHLRIFLSGAPNSFAAIYGFEILLENGRMLVDLFFVISGLILAHCYLDEGRMRRGVTFRKFCMGALQPAMAASLRRSVFHRFHAAIGC
jgi:peptidoglycan/LPS O-acetylase OafA/YrhL